MSFTPIQVRKAKSWYDDGWTRVPNDLARDHQLSLEARGLMLYMASHSEAFQVSVEHLMVACAVGRDKLRRIMKELIDAGYLEREQSVDPATGRLGLNSYVLHSRRSAPSTDLPSTGEPSPVNQPPLKKTNIKKTITSGGAELALADDDGALFLVKAEPVEVTAQAVTAAWIDKIRENGVEPTRAQIGRVARTAKELLAGNDGTKVLEAAKHAGHHGNAAIDSALTILNGKPFEPRTASRPARPQFQKTTATGMILDR